MNQGPCQNNSGAKVNVQITYINQQGQSTSRERESVCVTEIDVRVRWVCLREWLEGV